MIRPTPATGMSRLIVKRYAAGKAFAFADGAPEFAREAESALQQCVVVEAVVDELRFLRLMRERGVPDDVSLAYLRSVTLMNEAWFQDEWPG